MTFFEFLWETEQGKGQALLFKMIGWGVFVFDVLRWIVGWDQAVYNICVAFPSALVATVLLVSMWDSYVKEKRRATVYGLSASHSVGSQ